MGQKPADRKPGLKAPVSNGVQFQVRRPEDKAPTITTPKETATIRRISREIQADRRIGLLLARRSVGGAPACFFDVTSSLNSSRRSGWTTVGFTAAVDLGW